MRPGALKNRLSNLNIPYRLKLYKIMRQTKKNSDLRKIKFLAGLLILLLLAVIWAYLSLYP